MRWQNILKYGGSGVVSLFFIISALLNLTGMDSTSSGDITCGETCESFVNITSTYWRICFENSKDKEIIYKKRTRSRTLWVNLDKITEFVITDPKVKVQLQVPARGKGNWRDIKENDCINRKTKSRPKPNRFKIVGHKDITQTVKWSFILDDYLMKKIDIDPIWKGIETNVTWKEKAIITDDGKVITTEIGSKLFSIDYDKTKFKCSKVKNHIECDSCLDGNCNGKIDYDLSGNRIGETNWFINETHVIEYNSKGKPSCKVSSVKGRDFFVCTDSTLSIFVKRLNIE